MPSPAGRYRIKLWPGESGKGMCYEVFNPRGQLLISGARADTKAGTEKQLQKFIKRAELRDRGEWV